MNIRQLTVCALFIAGVAMALPYQSAPKSGAPQSYWDAHEAKLDDPTQPMVIFLGDSITSRWETDGDAIWDTYWTSDPNEPVMGWTCGGSGDTTSNLLFRMGDGVLDNRGTPAWIVILIGTNNLAASDSAWEIMHGIMRVMQATRRRLPASRQMVISILPRKVGPGGITTAQETKRTTINDYLSNEVPTETTKGCIDGCSAVFLDVEADFADNGTLRPGLFLGDGLHLSDSGYEVLAERILAGMQQP